MPKHLLHGHIIALRKKGRRRKRWLQYVEQGMGTMGLSFEMESTGKR